MSSSSTVEDRYHRLPNSFWVSSGQELMNNNPVPFQVVSGAHLFSSSSGFCNDSLHGRISQTHPPPINTMPSDRFAMQDQPQEFTVPLEDFFDFDDHVPVPNLQAQSTGARVVSSEELYRKSEWQNWADELISVDDGSQPNWSQLLGDSSDHNPNPKMPDPFSDVPRLEIKAIEQHQMVSSEEQLSGRNVTSKQRMRWTQELHEAFVDAVNHLGGSEQAKPKAVVKLLNVPGLTIYHVKSHLQKYRTARYKPETSIEVTGEAQEKKMTSVEDVKTLDMKTSFEITQALRLQMEVQKRLHEQLEIQRSLQLQIEKQGRYLQMMFEKQQKLQQENKSSSPSEPSPSNTSAQFGLETESASASRKRVRED